MKKFLYLLALLVSFNSISAQINNSNNTNNNGYDSENETHLIKTNLNTVTLPFQLIENLIVIDVIVNQKKGKAVFDTGNQAYFAANSEYFVEEIVEKNASFRPDTATGISGNIPVVYNIKIDSLLMDDFCFSYFDAVAFNMSHIRKAIGKDLLGFIGFGVMKECEWAIDYRNKLIHIYRLDQDGNTLEKPSYNKKELFEFDAAKGSPIASLNFAGKNVNFFLDTGAPANSLDSNVISGIDTNYLSFTGLVDALSGGDGGYLITNVAVMKQLSIKDISFVNMPTNVYKFFGNSANNGTLGYPFFSQKLFIFNFKKNKIYINE